MLLLSEIKEIWISFFKGEGYTELKELAIVPPENDDSILWVNSGVSALKKYFVNPDISPSKNMVNSQRVIRTNDIERINENSYHQTFFEMLGCFSIGGNFKSDVVPLIWSFFTEKLGINPSNLFVTVLNDDYETFSIWENQAGLSKERIFFCGKESNFWDMGDGPCGPNTEIYYCFDPRKVVLDSKGVDFDDKNFLEIANLVFSEFYHKDKNYLPLEKKCVDVGVGLERVALVSQGVSNTFEIDIWKSPLLFLKDKYDRNLNCQLVQNRWKFNVIVDHLRTFMIAVFDGVLPESKHRGYIIRKLIKRVFWFSFFLGFSTNDLAELASVIIDSNSHIGGIFNKKEYIIEIVKAELTRISDKVQSYQGIIDKYLDENFFTKEVPADKIFFWYDTKGMPMELISFSLKNRGFYFGEDGFEMLLAKQKEMGTSDQKKKKTSVF